MNQDLILQPAPDFDLVDLQGQTQRLSEMRGKPVLLNFFRTTCPWCQIELPRLAEVYDRLAKVDAYILGIAVGGDTPEAVAQFSEEKELHFPVAVDNGSELSRAFHLERVPAVVLLDGDGFISRVYQGSSEQLSGIVEQTLLSAAENHEPPAFDFIGNGCAAS